MSLLEKLVGSHLELFNEELELLLLLEPELPLFEPELFFLLFDWLLGLVDLSDLLALLELVAFSQDITVTFPVVDIDGLDKGAELVEVVQFSDSCDFILDAAGKSVVELVVEGSITPIDFVGELLKADNVFSNFLVIMYFELFNLIFSISFDVERAKVGSEFGDEFVIIVRPSQVGVQVHE